MSLRSYVGKITAIASLASIVAYSTAIVASAALLVLSPIGHDLLQHQTNLTVGALFTRGRLPWPVNRLTLFVASLSVYVACFWAASIARGGLIQSLRNMFRDTKLTRTPNWLAVMPFVSSALLIIILLIVVIQDSLGLPSGSLYPPDEEPEPFVLLLGLTYAPILEEVEFRITTFGFLLSLRVLWSYRTSGATETVNLRKAVLWSFLVPERAKRLAGLATVSAKGWKGLHWSEWGLLAGTSLVFGLAHVLSSGSSWLPGKATTAALSGLIIGIVFIIYGAYAAILLHWFFDSYFISLALASALIGGLFTSIATINFLLTLGVGIFSLGVVTGWLFTKIVVDRPLPDNV